MLEPPKVNAKVQRAYLLYDGDFPPVEVFYRVDLTVERDGEAIGTPRPPLYLARLQTKKPLEVPTRESWEMRLFNCCFESSKTKTGEENRRVYNPYRPGTTEWRELARQLINWPEIKAIDYTGETINNNLEAIL